MDILATTAQSGAAAYIITEVLKKAGLKSKYTPLAAVVAGAAVGVLLGGIESWHLGIISGIMGAGSAMGIHSGSKATFSESEEGNIVA